MTPRLPWPPSPRSHPSEAAAAPHTEGTPGGSLQTSEAEVTTLGHAELEPQNLEDG